MSIKPFVPLSSFKPLPGSGLVRLTGRDAAGFAQAQFANDVQALQDQQWQWNLWLSAKGRVIALFALIRLAPEDFLIWLPDYPASLLAEQLQRFRFRSKVSITALNETSAWGVFCSPQQRDLSAEGSSTQVVHDAQGEVAHVVLDLSGAQQPRTLILSLEANQEEADPTFTARWQAADMMHGLPRLAESQIEAFTPQMLGLEHLRAFSVKKGCYPGQEIVARTHFLGQAKRTALRLKLDHPAEAGQRLQSASGAQAEIICCASTEDGIEALAVAPVDASEVFQSDDASLHATPQDRLPGLAR